MGEEGLHKIGSVIFLEQAPQFADFVGRKFVPLDKVSEHGHQRPAEHPAQKRLAGGIDAFLAPDERTVKVGASVLAEAQGLLPDEPVEKSLDRARVPGGVGLPQGFDDLTGGAGSEVPDHFHDFPFSFGDAGHFSHGALFTITSVIGERLHL